MNLIKSVIAAAVIAFGVIAPASAADMVFSTGMTFVPTGPALFKGSDLNVMVDRVNNLSDGSFPVTGNFSATGSITAGTSMTATTSLAVGTTAAITGVLTPTGGVAAAGGFTASCRTVAVGGLVPAVSTDFTDSTPVNTEAYIGEVFVPANCTATGVAVFNGSNVTDNIKLGIYSSAGALIANSVSTAGSGPDAYQRVAFSAPAALKGPATYYIVTTYAAGTSRYKAPPLGSFGCAKATGLTFDTLPTTITPPTTFTANLCNVASLY